VSQSTLVLALRPAAGAALERRLAAGGFRLEPVPHGRFRARGEGVVATFYDSGKLVIQGHDPQGFAQRFLDGAPPPAGRPDAGRGAGRPATGLTTIGSDESGKGDYFGPLVACAVRLEPQESAELTGGPVRDSKTMTDAECRRLGAALRGRFPHVLQRLDPPAYNARHAQAKNVNVLLAELHAMAIRALHRPGECGVRVVIDQFERNGRIARALADLGCAIEERPRAEDEPAVAAASVIAREQFLVALDELSEAWAVDLHPGAGAPTDRAARAFVRLHGPAALAQVAKVHFKTTAKVTGKGRA
jgi:ribonuclease HIII